MIAKSQQNRIELVVTRPVGSCAPHEPPVKVVERGGGRGFQGLGVGGRVGEDGLVVEGHVRIDDVVEHGVHQVVGDVTVIADQEQVWALNQFYSVSFL